MTQSFSAPAAPAAPRPVKTSTKGPSIMLAFGIAGLVFAIAGIVAAVFGIGGLTALTTGARPIPVEVLDDGSFQVRATGLTPGTDYVVCAAMSLDPSAVTISAGSADGPAVPASDSGSNVNVTVNGRTLVPQVQFTATDASDYVISVASGTRLTAASSLAVAEYAPFEAFGWNLFATIVGIFLAVFGAIAGLGLTIGGGAWRSRRKKNRRLVEQGLATEAP